MTTPRRSSGVLGHEFSSGERKVRFGEATKENDNLVERTQHRWEAGKSSGTCEGMACLHVDVKGLQWKIFSVICIINSFRVSSSALADI